MHNDLFCNALVAHGITDNFLHCVFVVEPQLNLEFWYPPLLCENELPICETKAVCEIIYKCARNRSLSSLLFTFFLSSCLPPACLPNHLVTCLPTLSPFCLVSVQLSRCLPAYLAVCLPASLNIYLSATFPALSLVCLVACPERP